MMPRDNLSQHGKSWRGPFKALSISIEKEIFITRVCMMRKEAIAPKDTRFYQNLTVIFYFFHCLFLSTVHPILWKHLSTNFRYVHYQNLSFRLCGCSADSTSQPLCCELSGLHYNCSAFLWLGFFNRPVCLLNSLPLFFNQLADYIFLSELRLTKCRSLMFG